MNAKKLLLAGTALIAAATLGVSLALAQGGPPSSASPEGKPPSTIVPAAAPGAPLNPARLPEEYRSLALEPNIVPGEQVVGKAPIDGPYVPGKPVDARPSDYPELNRTAFKEQTDAPYVKTKTVLETKVLATGLVRAWKIAFLPDRRMLITERTGRVRIFTPDGKAGAPLTGLPKPLNFSDAGFFDIVLDPDFATNRRVFYSYAEIRPDGNGTTVVSAQLSPDETGFINQKNIFAAPSARNTGHYGGKLLVTPDRKLLITVGERIDYRLRIQSQNLDSPIGKLLRVNLDGTVPQDNPYAKVYAADGAIWAMGLRNSIGLAYAPDGKLWASDIGAQTADEINIITRTGNYGWPLTAYSRDYNSIPVNGGATQWPGTIQPVYFWDPTTAPASIAFYNSNLIPEWKGNLFVAHLRGQHISRLIIRNDKVVGEERLIMDQKQRVRDVEVGPDGAIWALTDNADGRLIRIAPPGK